MAQTATISVAGLVLAVLTSSVVASAPPPSPALLHQRHLRAPLALTEVADSRKATQQAEDPLPAGWFGAFSQGESTYTTEGNDARKDNPAFKVKYGRDPSLEGPYGNGEAFLKPEFFHESQSGGYVEAWQSSHPSIEGGPENRDSEQNHWSDTPSGWHQDYRSEDPVPNIHIFGKDTGIPQSAGQIDADFFDNSIHQTDGFSRKMQPSREDGAFYNTDVMWMWKERSVNTTLTCKEPGCTARVSLKVYEPLLEEVRLCSLSIHVHPTDYEDDWSREHVEFLKVNDYVVTRQCNPRARGCNKTAELPLYPCVNALNVDKLLDGSGTMVIEGKNTIMVDECPYNGNLLAGVAMATCMVRPLPLVTPSPKPVAWQGIQKCEGIVKCKTPGCTGEALIPCNPGIALNGGTCKMNVTVRQTDYDDHLGLPEQIDFLQVEGVSVVGSSKSNNSLIQSSESESKGKGNSSKGNSSKGNSSKGKDNVTTGAISPGKNPCNKQYKESLLTIDNFDDSELWFPGIVDHDVTELMKTSHPLGFVKVTGKISDQVDECGYEGNLLWAKVDIHCTPPGNWSALPPGGMLELQRILPADIWHAGSPIALQKTASHAEGADGEAKVEMVPLGPNATGSTDNQNAANTSANAAQLQKNATLLQKSVRKHPRV